MSHMAYEPLENAPKEGALADKIEWLYRHRWPAGLPPAKNYAEAAAALTQVTGLDISTTGLWKIRTGRTDNPQLKTMRALAAFFDVPFGFFGEGEESERAQDNAAATALLKDGGIERDVLRALVELSPENKELVTEVIVAAARIDVRKRDKVPDKSAAEAGAFGDE